MPDVLPQDIPLLRLTSHFACESAVARVINLINPIVQSLPGVGTYSHAIHKEYDA